MKAKWIAELEDVTVRREHAVVLDRVSMGVARKTIHAIVGKNGAGKSTLLHTLLGEIEFTGNIRFRFEAGRGIGFVPQRLAVDRTLPVTVGDFFALTRQPRPIFFGVGARMRTRVESALASFGLEGYQDRLLGTLSGGELQRVLIADALERTPEILLLDEPSTGLDAGALDRLAELMIEARDRFGTTVVFVAHDFDLVGRISDRVTHLDGGAAKTGRPQEILA